MLCGSCIQPKKQFKIQIIGILEERDSFYWSKMHLWKGHKKTGQISLLCSFIFLNFSLEFVVTGVSWVGQSTSPPPLSFEQNPKEQKLFFWTPSLSPFNKLLKIYFPVVWFSWRQKRKSWSTLFWWLASDAVIADITHPPHPVFQQSSSYEQQEWSRENIAVPYFSVLKMLK